MCPKLALSFFYCFLQEFQNLQKRSLHLENLPSFETSGCFWLRFVISTLPRIVAGLMNSCSRIVAQAMQQMALACPMPLLPHSTQEAKNSSWWTTIEHQQNHNSRHELASSLFGVTPATSLALCVTVVPPLRTELCHPAIHKYSKLWEVASNFIIHTSALEKRSRLFFSDRLHVKATRLVIWFFLLYLVEKGGLQWNRI